MCYESDSKYYEEELDKFDDERITKGLVTDKEISELKQLLITMFIKRAATQGKDIVCINSEDERKKLIESKEWFAGNTFYIYIDEEEKVDMTSILYQMLNTKEGLFYAKCTLY